MINNPSANRVVSYCRRMRRECEPAEVNDILYAPGFGITAEFREVEYVVDGLY